MPPQTRYPTQHKDVNAILDLLHVNVKTTLEGQFVGMYLYGSLATGDFDLQRSDIDFLVVTKDELPSKLVSALEAMHHCIAKNGLKWAKKLEGSYIPQKSIRRYDSSQAHHPSIGVDWEFGIGHHGIDWIIQRYVIREHGVVLSGPPPKTLIDPVSPHQLRSAVLGTLRDWWAPMIHDPSWLKNKGSEYHAYAVLTMCRSFHTLQQGTITSKPVAARWAQKKLDHRWTSLIEQSLSWQPDQNIGTFQEVLDFIQYTLKQAQDLINQ